MAPLCGCGKSGQAPSGAATAPENLRPAFGITEDNANLLWNPGSPPPAAAGVTASSAAARGGLDPRTEQLLNSARRALDALHPAYVRLLIDWAALQPDRAHPANLEAPVAGCARGIGPCAPYAGVRAQLAAIASQQRARGGARAVVVIFGTPAWAARAPAPCEGTQRGSFSRPLSSEGLGAYRELIRSLLALGAREGVALDWWSPWNEPNNPTFLSPQHDSCSESARAGRSQSAAGAYAELVRAMATQLHDTGGHRHLLLGELNAYEASAPDRSDIAQFVAALPADVLCLGDVWSVHAYASRGPFAPARDPVAQLEAALAPRGRCADRAPIWVTEAGAGAPHAGSPRTASASEEAAGCAQLARELAGWSADPRVGVVLQYTFREDPAFPVGVLGPELEHVYPAYRLWLAWTKSGSARAQPAALMHQCA